MEHKLALHCDDEVVSRKGRREYYAHCLWSDGIWLALVGACDCGHATYRSRLMLTSAAAGSFSRFLTMFARGCVMGCFGGGRSRGK